MWKARQLLDVLPANVLLYEEGVLLDPTPFGKLVPALFGWTHTKHALKLYDPNGKITSCGNGINKSFSSLKIFQIYVNMTVIYDKSDGDSESRKMAIVMKKWRPIGNYDKRG